MEKKIPEIKIVYADWSDEQVLFVIEKLKEKNSFGKILTYPSIVEICKKNGMKKIDEKQLLAFITKYRGLLERQGVQIGKDRANQISKGHKLQGRF